MAKTPRKNGKADEAEKGGTFLKELVVKIDTEAKHAKEARIREALTERVKLDEKMRPSKLKRKALTEEVEKLREEAESLQEKRKIRCRLEFDYKRQRVMTIRLDTGAPVPELERTMTDEDKQEGLLETKAGRSKLRKGKGARKPRNAPDGVPGAFGAAPETESRANA